MTGQYHDCHRSEVDHVRKFLSHAKAKVNEAGYYPPYNGYRYMVALALYSKCITVAEATIALLEAGFSDEAFGMTRTLVDIFFTLRYIANKDTDNRAKLYYEFFTKDTAVWGEVIKDYFPGQAHRPDPRTLARAASYPNPHRWAGVPVSALASEPDTLERDKDTGKPLTYDFAYRSVYRWTSHYVHPTIVALENHIVQAGRDRFVVRNRRAKDKGHMAMFNLAVYLCQTMQCFYRVMDDPVPGRLDAWAMALLKHLTRRHK